MVGERDSVLELFAASLRDETQEALLRCPGDPQQNGFGEVLRKAERFDAVQTLDRPVPNELGQESLASEAKLPSLALADPVLDQFCVDLRASTELALQPRTTGITRATRPRKRARWAPVAGVFAAAAAMAVLLIDAPGMVQLGQTLKSHAASLASWNHEQVTEPDGIARSRRRVAQSSNAVRGHQEMGATPAVESDAPLLEEAIEPHPEPVQPALSEQQLPGEVTDSSPKKLSDAALMRQGQALWKKGKTKRAQRLFRRVAYRSSNRDTAQAAFADLFSIGRQLGGRSVLKKEWSRYLKKFPKGRYAQDAMAGLCAAHEQSASQKTCWSNYLKRFPRGVYARRAKKTLASGQ